MPNYAMVGRKTADENARPLWERFQSRLDHHGCERSNPQGPLDSIVFPICYPETGEGDGSALPLQSVIRRRFNLSISGHAVKGCGTETGGLAVRQMKFKVPPIVRRN